MSHSLVRLPVHLVFSTKNRAPLLGDHVRDALHRYMSGVLSKLDCPPVLINSVEDHVHILFNLGRSIALSKAVEDLKTSSSKWLKAQAGPSSAFRWQNGYGAFAVSETNVDAVRKYILRQRDHHKKRPIRQNTGRCSRRTELP
ncbi:MAG TPA: IS200/IS605 family transposase [Polyangiaceae bacterium]|nr:IS200/IS605 family transposase [Polyangiaceae bacterium]